MHFQAKLAAYLTSRVANSLKRQQKQQHGDNSTKNSTATSTTENHPDREDGELSSPEDDLIVGMDNSVKGRTGKKLVKAKDDNDGSVSSTNSALVMDGDNGSSGSISDYDEDELAAIWKVIDYFHGF